MYNVKIAHPFGETELNIPEKKLELVRALALELATAAKNTPNESAAPSQG